MGDDRIKIGLIFTYNENWIGGSYYILNLIKALLRVSDEIKPHLVIYCSSYSEFRKVQVTGYPYLEYKEIPKINKTQRFCNRVLRFFIGKNLFGPKIDTASINVLFPWSKNLRLNNSEILKLNWIQDFQEAYLPEMFDKNELIRRRVGRAHLLNDDNNHVVVSSMSSFSDLRKFYPNFKAQIHVLPFAVTHPDYQKVKIDYLLNKFELPNKYFMSPNQFWKHKNHLIVLNAIKDLKKSQPDILVIFTGKEYDNRNPTYTHDLKSYVINNGLKENIKFLGFIDRKEQLQLMNNAHAIIQPSLFEGWSTVIEDSKSMNKSVIASSIEVHMEQMEDQAVYFDPYDVQDLSCKLEASWTQMNKKKIDFDYERKIILFGQNFLDITNNK